MKRIVLLLLCFLTLTSYAQQRQVKVTTNKGSVYEGTLDKFKAFEYVIIAMEGRTIMIPYDEMAYIDDITPVEKTEKTPAVEEATSVVEETIEETTPIVEDTMVIVKAPEIIAPPKVNKTSEIVVTPEVLDASDVIESPNVVETQ